MKLSPHFTLDEFTISHEGSRRGLDNTPNEFMIMKLKILADKMEDVRILLNDNPINVLSAYRCPAVNAAVKGSKTSQHMAGEAVDFTCSGFGTPKEIVDAILKSDLVFDQVIHEYNSWVHISFTQHINRRMALTIDTLGTRFYA
jgi:zinc D-Ala-D-Ala carboxypeptidase